MQWIVELLDSIYSFSFLSIYFSSFQFIKLELSPFWTIWTNFHLSLKKKNIKMIVSDVKKRRGFWTGQAISKQCFRILTKRWLKKPGTQLESREAKVGDSLCWTMPAICKDKYGLGMRAMFLSPTITDNEAWDRLMNNKIHRNISSACRTFPYIISSFRCHTKLWQISELAIVWYELNCWSKLILFELSVPF